MLMFDNSPNPHPIKNLWWDTKIAAQSSSSPSRLKLFCQDKWPKNCSLFICRAGRSPAQKACQSDSINRWFGPVLSQEGLVRGNLCAFHRRLCFLSLCATNNPDFYHSKHFSSIADQKLNSGKTFIATEGCKTAECVWIGNVSRTWRTTNNMGL